MTLAVSYTDFRNNLSDHLNYLKKGNRVVIRDAKKGKDIVTLVAEKEEEFDWDAHIRWARNFRPIFTDEDVKTIKNLRKKGRARLKRLNW